MFFPLFINLAEKDVLVGSIYSITVRTKQKFKMSEDGSIVLVKG
ncbi:hypothetical protein [Hydrogenobaculum acidophilum]